MSRTNFSISAGNPLEPRGLSLPDQEFIMQVNLAGEIQNIDLHDVLTIESGWSMTLAGGFLPLPDLVVISMRDGSQHQISVGLFGVLFGHRGYWVTRLSRALTKLRLGITVSVSLVELSKAVSESTRLTSHELVNRT
jgi:hypothetical protein